MKIKSEVGLVEDKSHVDVERIKNQLINMQEHLPSYKQRLSELTISKMRQEQADETLEAKW